MDQGRDADAEEEFLAVLRLGQAFDHPSRPRDVDIFTASDLGRLYCGRREYAKAVTHISRAVVWANELWAKNHHLLHCLRSDLEAAKKKLAVGSKTIPGMSGFSSSGASQSEPCYQVDTASTATSLDAGDDFHQGFPRKTFHLDWSYWTIDQKEKQFAPLSDH